MFQYKGYKIVWDGEFYSCKVNPGSYIIVDSKEEMIEAINELTEATHA